MKPGCRWFGQTCPAPARQTAQRPHAMTNGAVTARPTQPSSTPSPTASTVPANSWPGTWGKVEMSSSWPIHPCQSLRHRPLATTRTTAPPGGGLGSGSDTTTGSAPKAA